MRKLIVSTMVTLNGVMENPHLWSFDYMNEEIMKYAYDQLFASDALIMGRQTYEGFAEAWSARAGADAFADRMNNLPKYVASRTLKAPLTWNAQLLQEDIVTAVSQLKQQPGQNLLQYGSGELTHTLIQKGLVDELRLLVYPVIMGSGKHIFEDLDKTALKLLDVKCFSSGVVAQHYQPVPPQ
ncbi:MAG TPA: dihydrofolate reductase family protein [Phototrophicaceae bacterium]|nr:dihydrofolate reductase family protein [Phototrophicaceae bacterium]